MRRVVYHHHPARYPKRIPAARTEQIKPARRRRNAWLATLAEG
jgi:hypothetical protein